MSICKAEDSPLGAKGDPQMTDRKEMEIFIFQSQEIVFVHKMNEFGSGFFTKPPSENLLTDILILALRNPEQRNN